MAIPEKTVLTECPDVPEFGPSGRGNLLDTDAGSKTYFFQRVRRLFEEQLPFNNVLGLQVTQVDQNGATMRFQMRDDLIGNSFQRTLHGGVISAVLDAVGGLTVLASLAERMAGMSEEKASAMFSRSGTIDLRVDYLRPGRGDWFAANGRIMRTGRKVAVARMEMHNNEEVLVAVGTGTYMIG